MANVTRLGPVMWRSKYCLSAPSKTYEVKGFLNFSYTENTDSSTNKKTYNITRIWFSTEGTDNGYFSTCPGEASKCTVGCCDVSNIYWNNNGSWAKLCTLDFARNYPGTNSSFASVSTNMTVTLYPGQSFTLTVGKGEVSCGSTGYAEYTFRNTLSEPVRDSAPTVRLSCSASSTNPHSLTTSYSGSYGTCSSGQYNTTTYGLYTSSSYSSSSLVSSSTGTFNSAQSNTTYYGKVTRSNGCYTATSTCSVTTIPENKLANLTATGPNSATMNLTVMGGPAYAITTQVQMRPCTSGTWKTIKTVTTAKGSSQQFYTIDVDELEDDTCYQFQAVSTTTAGSYYSGTLTTQTPKVGAFAFFDSIDSEITNDNDIKTTFCYNWQAKSTPAQVTVFYRVKDGYDPIWLAAGDTITVTTATGTRCVEATGLFPNQVEYEAYIHTYIPQYDVEWDGEITTFITPLLPVPEFYQCETLNYMAELLCSSVKRLYSGNKTIYANPASREECDPYSEEPTCLTLWSRALRFFTATKCLAEGMMGTLLMQSKPGQYLVGEYGWATPLNTLEDWENEDELWRLPSSMGAYAYLNEKMHSVWHYHSAVDYLEQTLDELKAAEGATSGIVMDDNKVYTKAGNNRWVASTTDIPDDFAVYHINKTSKYAEAGQAWFYWGGTWKNLDSDITNAMERVKEVEAQSDVIVDNETGAADITFTVVDENYDFEQLPADGNRYVCLLTEDDSAPEQPLRVMFVGWTPELSADNTPISVLNPDCETIGSTSSTCTENDWIVPVSYYSSITYSDCSAEPTFGVQALQCKALIQPVMAGKTAQKPADPIYPGHKFLGWRLGVFTNGQWQIDDSFYDFDTPVEVDFIEQNMCLFAQWSTEMINIVIQENPDVQGPYPSEPVQVPRMATVGSWGTYNEALDLSQYSSEDGEIVGWGQNEYYPLPCGAILQNGGTQSVTPMLKYHTVPVTYVLNNGEDNIIQDVRKKSRTQPPEGITRYGYELDHWSLYNNPSAPQFNFLEPIIEPITLYAIWVETPYTVTFDTNGGQPPIPSVMVRDGAYISEPPQPSNGECTFQGWYTDGHYVTFEDGNGNIIEKQGVLDGGYAIQPPTPSNGECVFQGWYYDTAQDQNNEAQDEQEDNE